MTKNLIASPRAKIALMGGLVLALALIGWVTSAFAITWGEPDTDNNYPNVGAIIVHRNDDRIWALCSGTLIHEQVFLTAAHCTDYIEDLDSEGRLVALYMSFDFDVNLDQAPVLLDVAEVFTHPNYNDFEDPSNPYDVGALVLEEPVEGIEPADLPTEGFLDELKRSGVLRVAAEGAKFTVVGYGGVLNWYRQPPEIT